MDYLFQIRVTGILLENEKVLIVKQKVSNSREWSLPGGRMEQGETLESSIVREILEETGLQSKIIKLLYLCDIPIASPPLLHITFLMEKVGGVITLPTNEFDQNPISDVRMVTINNLKEYGFSDKFVSLVNNGFPDSGCYMGLKTNIGL
jgi:ADP-ribose pyrophosphatase YjhB (NUDIX family)